MNFVINKMCKLQNINVSDPDWLIIRFTGTAIIKHRFTIISNKLLFFTITPET